jgi:hypothetical protein
MKKALTVSWILLLQLVSLNEAFSENSVPCKSMTQVSPVGTICRTSAGIDFIRLEGAWQDTGTNGHIWYDEAVPGLMQQEGIDHCAKEGKVLPSLDDTYVASSHQIVEVLQDIAFCTKADAHDYWTSTPFSGGDGNVYYYYQLTCGSGDLAHDFGYGFMATRSRFTRCIK